MNTAPETIIYLACLDNGKLICNQIDGLFVLPHISLPETYESRNDAKKELIRLTHLAINKGCFSLVQSFKEEKLLIYSAIVDLTQKRNERVFSKDGMKEMPFCLAFVAKWDEGSLMAIHDLSKNPRFRDAMVFLDTKSIFHCYSKESNELFDKTIGRSTNVWQFDKPDVVIENAEGIIGVESFRINASGINGEKGSKGIADKKAMEIELKKQAKPWTVKTVTRHFSNSLGNLWNDFIYGLSTHLNRQDYKTNLQRIFPNKEISIGLLVDDTTLLGSNYKHPKDGNISLFLFNLQEFWDIFLANDGISFFLFRQSEISDSHDLFFITKDDYPVLKKSDRIFRKDELDAWFFNEPHMIGSFFPL